MELRAEDPAVVLEKIRTLDVVSASLIGTTGEWFLFEILPAKQDPRPALFEAAVHHGWKLRELSARESSLEEIFTSLVQPSLQSSHTLGKEDHP
jgi:hypothetical protein